MDIQTENAASAPKQGEADAAFLFPRAASRAAA